MSWQSCRIVLINGSLIQDRCGSGGKSDRNKTALGDGGKGGSGKGSFKVDVVVSDRHGNIVVIWDDSADI